MALTHSLCWCSQVRSLANTVEALKQNRYPWILSFTEYLPLLQRVLVACLTSPASAGFFTVT